MTIRLRPIKTLAPKRREPALPADARDKKASRTQRELEQSLKEEKDRHYVLRLYVTGASRQSAHAIERVREICEGNLKGRYELEIIDIYQLPALAKGDQIVATPTLIRVLPEPLRRYIGNLTNAEKIIFGLDLRSVSR